MDDLISDVVVRLDRTTQYSRGGSETRQAAAYPAFAGNDGWNF
jgi:hypothetical protein